MKRIGLIGGITWSATADYYRYINLEVRRRLGGHHSADMVIRSLDLHPLLENAQDIARVERVFADAGADLYAAGAEFIAVASFTGHRYVRPLRAQALPLFDLIESLGQALRETKHRRVAVWATSYALGDVNLMSQLAERSGAELLTPAPELRSKLDSIVFNELAIGQLTDDSTALLQQLLTAQVQQDAQALLLATTDFSPLLTLLNSPVPLLDATQIHCQTLVDAALT